MLCAILYIIINKFPAFKIYFYFNLFWPKMKINKKDQN